MKIVIKNHIVVLKKQNFKLNPTLGDRNAVSNLVLGQSQEMNCPCISDRLPLCMVLVIGHSGDCAGTNQLRDSMGLLDPDSAMDFVPLSTNQ